MSEAATATRSRRERDTGNGTPSERTSPDLRLGGRRIVVEPHNCFACGTLNEHGLQLTLHAEDGRCWTELSLGKGFEGWDGIAHGGVVCTLLDEVMAWATIEHEAWGVTARMTVSFKRPVPIETAIRGEGWVEDARKRLIHTGGRIVDVASGIILATAAGTYMAASPERREELRRRYAFRLVDEPAPVEA